MLERDTVYILDYYKKNMFMGSDGPLNFRIYKVENEKEDGEDKVEQLQLEVACWPGPFIFAKTPEKEKRYKRFAFSEEGICEAVAWINAEHDQLVESQQKNKKR